MKWPVSVGYLLINLTLSIWVPRLYSYFWLQSLPEFSDYVPGGSVAYWDLLDVNMDPLSQSGQL